MAHVLTVCLVLVITTSFALADLQYECTKGSSGSLVDITIDKGSPNNLTSADLKEIGALCNLTDQSTEFLLKNCPADKNIKVQVMSHGNDNVVKEKDFASYTLQCHYDSKVFYAFVSAAKVSITDATPAASTVSVHSVKMTAATPTFSMQLDKTSVVIGEKVMITITGPANEVYSVDECVATSGKYNHTLWSSNCDDVDDELFGKEDWSNDTNTDISHNFFAFRFTDTTDIKLICKLKVCPAGVQDQCSLSCSQGGINGVTQAVGRRRRSITEEESAVVQTSFTVSDPESAFTESSVVSTLPTAVSIIVCLYTLFSRI